MSHIDESGAWFNPGPDEVISPEEWLRKEAVQRLPLHEPSYVVVGTRTGPEVCMIKIRQDFSCIPAEDNFHWPSGLAGALRSLIGLYNSARHIQKAREEGRFDVIPKLEEHLDCRFYRLIRREGVDAVAESLHNVIQQFEAGTYRIEDRSARSRPFG